MDTDGDGLSDHEEASAALMSAYTERRFGIDPTRRDTDGDGVEDGNDKTPLEVARTPAMDRASREGLLGLARTVPRRMPPGSDVAIMSVMGYDPAACYTGRGPLGRWVRPTPARSPVDTGGGGPA